MKAFPPGLIVCLSAQLCAAQFAAPVITLGGGLVASPTLVTITHANPVGTIFYTLDGGDPREHFGAIAAAARSYETPLSVNRSLILRARVKAGAVWSAPAVAAFTADQDFSKLLFTEVMYHPRDDGDLEEFVELKNVGATALNLAGLFFNIAGPNGRFRFEPGAIIQPGAFVVLVHDVAAFRAIHPVVHIDGVLPGELGNGDISRITFERANGAIAARMSYRTGAPWPAVCDNHGYFPMDGVGFSLVRTTLDPVADPEHHGTWRASTQRSGSPGADDPAPVVPTIYINELLTRASGALRDSIEFFNPNPMDVHIGGWWLSDERNEPFRFPIPLGTIVPAFGYLVMDETQFDGPLPSVSFSAEGERCYFFSGDANGELTGYSHGFQFSGSDRDVSFGRHLVSDGSANFPSQTQRTFGAANSGPQVSPVVISEVMPQPAAGDSRYVELRNTTDGPIALFDPPPGSARWAVGSVFSQAPLPAEMVIPAQGHGLLVEGSPDAFRARHNVPAEVPILFTFFQHPFDGETPQLFRPSGMAGQAVRYVAVDHIAQRQHAPWPVDASIGEAIERIDPHSFGNDPANWRASPTLLSPGRANSGNLPPQVWAGGNRVAFVARAGELRGAVSDDRWPGATVSSTWSRVSGPGAVQFTGAGLDVVTATFPVSGQYVIRLSVTDGASTSSDVATIEVIERPFDIWRTAHFTAAERADDAISGPRADPDRDGSSNAAEYFFATDPKIAGSSQPLTATLVSGYLQAVWRQRLETPDIVPVPERADRLEGPWFAGEDFFEISETGSLIVKMVTVRDRLPVAGRAQSFLRLRLVLR